MGYQVDYAEAEKKGCSSRLTIANRIFYAKLFESPTQPPKYFAGDQNGVITKEISRNEFDFWLRTLADKKTDLEDIAKKIAQGKKYSK